MAPKTALPMCECDEVGMADCPRHGLKTGAEKSETRKVVVRCFRALRNRHNPAGLPPSNWQWCYLPELRLGPRRVDAWAIKKQFPSFERRAYEVKVSRSDFFSEVHNPEKRQPALEISNRFYFVAPCGLILPNELPSDCGLIEVVISKSGIHDRTKVKVEAPWRDIEERADLSLLCEVARRAA